MRQAKRGSKRKRSRAALPVLGAAGVSLTMAGGVPGGGLGKIHGEPTGAEIVPELLPEQHFDIRLIVNHENEKVHARSPDLIRAAPARGRTIRNSVNAPGCVSTSIDPPCCLTMMS